MVPTEIKMIIVVFLILEFSKIYRVSVEADVTDEKNIKDAVQKLLNTLSDTFGTAKVNINEAYRAYENEFGWNQRMKTIYDVIYNLIIPYQSKFKGMNDTQKQLLKDAIDQYYTDLDYFAAKEIEIPMKNFLDGVKEKYNL